MGCFKPYSGSRLRLEYPGRGYSVLCPYDGLYLTQQRTAILPVSSGFQVGEFLDRHPATAEILSSHFGHQ